MTIVLDGQPTRPPFPERRRFPLIRKLVDHPVFGIGILLLVMLSVVLILVETFSTLAPETLARLELLNEFLTLLFLVELFLRWLVSVGTGSFLRRHWIDILAVVPMLRFFRLSGIFRLVRLLRIFTLGAILQRRIVLFGAVVEGRVIEYGIIVGFSLFAILFGAVGLSQFEVGPGLSLSSHTEAFWKSLFSLLTGEYAGYPESFGGKVVFAGLTLFGMGMFAMLTGTFTAVMMEKLKESAMQNPLSPQDLQGHIIICGYSAKIAILVSEFTADPKFADCDLLIVSQHATLEDLKARKVPTEHISILREDFTLVETLVKAGVKRAQAAIVLSEAGPGRSTQDIDARTLLAALTVERLNPGIHTSAELYHPEYADHLKMGGVEDVVIQGEVSGRLLARVAMQEGLLGFFQDILSRTDGNALSFLDLPAEYVGQDVAQVIPVFHQKMHALVVGVRSQGGVLRVNPRGHRLQSGDHLLVMIPAKG